MLTRLADLRALSRPEAVIVKTCGGEITPCDVEGFIAPRQALLMSGELEDFREWQLQGRTQVFGDIAHHFCIYAKPWREGGRPVTGQGMKTIQMVRTTRGWRISGGGLGRRAGGAQPADSPRDR